MPSHPLADADARRDKNVPEPSDEQYASLFDEAILLRMIPYDYRVYDRYFFSKCDSHDEIEQLLRIHYMLRYDLGIEAKVIADWCKRLRFSHEVKERIPNAMSIALVQTHHEGRWMTPPVTNLNQVNFSRVRTKWFKQAKDCHSCPNCEAAVNDALKRKRYPYLAFGMIVWRMKPSQVEFNYLNIWQFLGYSYADEESLFNAYKAAFSRDIGVATIYFEGYLDRNVSTQWLLGKLPNSGFSDEGDFLYEDLATLLENEKSIWRLKEALNSGLNWEDVQNSPLFKDVTQKYGYDQLYLLPNSDEVARNLREAYNTAFDEGPVELYRACEARNLQVYMSELWYRIKGFPLDSGTQWVLQAADHQKLNLSHIP